MYTDRVRHWKHLTTQGTAGLCVYGQLDLQIWYNTRGCMRAAAQQLPVRAAHTCMWICPASSMLSGLGSAHRPPRLGEGKELTNLRLPLHVMLPLTYTCLNTSLQSIMMGASWPVQALISTCMHTNTHGGVLPQAAHTRLAVRLGPVPGMQARQHGWLLGSHYETR